MKVNIGWINYKKDEVELQTKTFDTPTSALEWCRKNFKNINTINGVIFNVYAYGLGISQPVFGRDNHFEIMQAILKEK